jgi:CDP-paratose 2-epimerase
MTQTILITGGCGFLGTNITIAALERGLHVCVLDNLSRSGSISNLHWLQSRGLNNFVHGDIRIAGDIRDLIHRLKPDAVFHLAGQVAMTTSLADPYNDFLINAQGTLNLLEALRQVSPDTALIYASTNKVYGDLKHHTYTETNTRYICPDSPNGFNENEPLNFHSPYGCSKGSADQYCLDYARMYGLKTVVLRHSSMYGGRQFATEEQGWIGWFVDLAAQTKTGQKLDVSISGNGKQVRDILHAYDAAQLYFACLDAMPRISGCVFNAGGGMANSLSLLELLSHLETTCDIRIDIRYAPPRTSDQKIFVADNTTLQTATNWVPTIGITAGLHEMLNWSRSRLSKLNDQAR